MSVNSLSKVSSKGNWGTMHMAFEDKATSANLHKYGYVGFQPASPEPLLRILKHDTVSASRSAPST